MSKQLSGDASKVLEVVADFLNRLEKSEVEALVSGEMFLALSKRKSAHYRSKLNRIKVISREEKDFEPKSVVDNLRTLGSRAEGSKVLASYNLTRKDLSIIANFLDLLVRKDDKVERIQEKIVEATIGVRLNSTAIRGANLASKKGSK